MAEEQASSSSQPAQNGESSAVNTCANCGKAEILTPSPVDEALEPVSNLSPCTTCKSVRYCSRECKKAHFKAHKKACPKLAQEYAKTADIKYASGSSGKKDGHRGGLQKWQFDT